jgi:hypothetical protein
MEASEHFSEPQPIPRFNVWAEESPDTHFYINDKRITRDNFAPIEYFVEVNGYQLGLLHCEVSGDGQEAFIDGIDPVDGLAEQDLSEQDWLSIAVCVHGLTKVRRVSHPAGQTPFLEAV